MGYAISRYWRQNPFWFQGLPQEHQLLLIADYNISNEDPKRKKANQRNRLIEKIQQRKKRIQTQGAINGNRNQ